MIRGLNQTCTYWAPTETRDLGGKRTYAAPVQKVCRWEDCTEMYQDKQGEEKISKSKVFLTEDVALDGFVLLGTSAAADPTVIPEAYEIQQKSRIPDLRSVTSLITLYL